MARDEESKLRAIISDQRQWLFDALNNLPADGECAAGIRRVLNRYCSGQETREPDTQTHDVDRVLDVVTRLVAERDQARSIARVLAHAYTTDNRPPQAMVDAALAFEVRL